MMSLCDVQKEVDATADAMRRLRRAVERVFPVAAKQSSMNLERIVEAARSLAEHTGLKLSTVAVYAVNDGKFFDRIKAGGSCTLRTADRLTRYLSDNWPDDLEWPHDIPRPAPSKTGRDA